MKPAPQPIKGCRRPELVAVDGWSTMLGGLYPELEFAAVSVTELDLADESLGGIVACWSLFNLARSVVPEVVDCSSVLTSETVISSALRPTAECRFGGPPTSGSRTISATSSARPAGRDR